MEFCWYVNCVHSSKECTFRTMLAEECSKKIWMKYARITLKQMNNKKTPVICSCHFNETSGNPIPYYEKKRKLELSRVDSKPEEKRVEVEHLEIQLDQSQWYEFGPDEQINGLEIDLDQSHCGWYDFGPDEVDLPEPTEKNKDFSIPIEQSDIVNFEPNPEPSDHSQSIEETEDFSSPTMRTKIQDLKDQIENLLCSNENLQVENVELRSKLGEMNSISALYEQKLFENCELRAKIIELESRLAQIDYSFDFAFIENSNEKVFEHTGLPSKEIFYLVLNVMSKFEFKYVCGWTPTKVSQKNQLLMTLMKLRMDLRNFDLAQRFKCSVATVSNIVRSWILAMHEILFLQLMKDIPSRQQNKNCLPVAFKEFLNCRIVLDCTEMFTDKPHKMFQQKSVYSPYKHHVTFKSLLGVAPNGVLTYASRLYTGSTSDKKIVEHCGITHKLCAGDCVLADKGFLVKDVLPYGVDLNVPPFLTTPQFTRAQVRRTETIARARVHVERAINRVKNFRILKYIPSKMFYMASEVFQVCVALTNFQNPLIKEITSKL